MLQSSPIFLNNFFGNYFFYFKRFFNKLTANLTLFAKKPTKNG